MASKRQLKKDIQLMCNELFSESCILTSLIARSNSEQAEAVLEKIVNLEKDFLKRVGDYHGKMKPNSSKPYFRELSADWKKSLQAISEEMESASK